MIEYRLQFEQLIQEISSNEVEFFNTKVQKLEFRDHLNRIHSVFKFGKSKEPLVKFHLIGEDLELLQYNEKFNSLLKTIEVLKEKGGYLIFMRRDVSHDIKVLGIGAQILKALGVNDFKLISFSNVNEKQFALISGFGLRILEKIEI